MTDRIILIIHHSDNYSNYLFPYLSDQQKDYSDDKPKLGRDQNSVRHKQPGARLLQFTEGSHGRILRRYESRIVASYCQFNNKLGKASTLLDLAETLSITGDRFLSDVRL